MPNAPEELSPNVTCPRKDCKADIPVIDCYYVAQASVPQIGVTCLECGKPTTLSKAKTLAYAKEYSQIQLDIDNAAGYKGPEADEDGDFGDIVMRGLDAFGYGGPKNTQKKKIIRSMVDTVPAYRSQQGLQQLLLAQRIKPTDAMMISQFVFASGEESAMTLPGFGLPQQPGIPQMPLSQTPYQQPQPQQFGQPQAMYPQPNQPLYPYQQPSQPLQAPQMQQTADDGITIVETLDADGNIIERTIKQPKADQQIGQAPVELSMTEQFKEMIEVMTGAGMIRTNEPATEEVKPLTADDLIAVLTQYSESGNGSDDRYANMAQQIESLKSEIRSGREDALQAQIESLKEQVGKTTTDSRLSDNQFSETIKKDIEDMRIGVIKDIGDTIAKPLFEMQSTQSKLQTLMMVRELEQKDSTAPGAYVQMFTAGGTVADDTVQDDLGKWRDRASRLGAVA